MTARQAWYVRSKGEVRGPYPAGLISRHVLLGRIRKEDDVSHDGQHWRPLADVPELIPRLLQADPADPHVRERLSAARRWADERVVERRAHERAGDEHGDRRALEDESLVLARTRRGRLRGAYAPGNRNLIFVVSLCLAFIAAMVVLYRPPVAMTKPNCAAFPQPGVNWNNCPLAGARLSGVDLMRATLNSADLTGASLPRAQLAKADASFANFSLADLTAADLRGAKLVGAMLRNARLTGAQMQNADLSYANLTGADLAQAKLDGARLDHAIWVDGSTCAQGSVGKCER